MTTFTPETKHSTSYSAESKNIRSFMLKEDTFYLLLETGDKIILEPDYSAQYSGESKHSTSYTNETKH